MTPHVTKRPDAGLSYGERAVFWRVRRAICDTNSRDIDEDAHCRAVAKLVIEARVKAMAS